VSARGRRRGGVAGDDSGDGGMRDDVSGAVGAPARTEACGELARSGVRMRGNEWKREVGRELAPADGLVVTGQRSGLPIGRWGCRGGIGGVYH